MDSTPSNVTLNTIKVKKKACSDLTVPKTDIYRFFTKNEPNKAAKKQ